MKLHNIKVESKLKQKNLKPGQHIRQNPTAFKGYPGLTHTASQICEFIPNCERYIEPFAGLGRIAKRVLAKQMILNDKSDFAITYLKRHFNNTTITQEDYEDCIKGWDSEDSYYFLDPPWIEEIYSINPLTESTKPSEIYEKLEKILPKLKADWMIAGAVNGPLKKWGFYHKEVKSRKNYLFGKKARTYLVSNKPFRLHRQLTLEGNG